jgi:large subunit ribosomal protein L10
MISKSKKTDIVAGLVELLKDATGIYFVDYATMTVAQTGAFRSTLREKGIIMRVAKNTLIRRALDELGGYENMPIEATKGQTAMIISYDDPTAPSKIIKESMKKLEKPVYKAAVLEGEFFDSTKLEVLSTLPSKQDLYAAIVGSIGSPASGIVGAINAVMRDVASLVEEVAKKQNNVA